MVGVWLYVGSIEGYIIILVIDLVGFVNLMVKIVVCVVDVWWGNY